MHIVQMENHSDALAVWKGANITGQILLHFDAHLDMNWLPPKVIDQIAQLGFADLRRANGGAGSFQCRGLYDITNFLYAAAYLGMFDRIYWLRSFTPSLESIRHFFQQHLQGLTLEELQSMHQEGETIVLELFGVKLVLCSVSALPALDTHVIIDVDIDVLEPNPDTGEPKFRSLHDLCGKISTLVPISDLLTLALSVRGGFSPKAWRTFAPSIVATLGADSMDFVDDSPGPENDDFSAAVFALSHGQLKIAIELFSAMLNSGDEREGLVLFHLGNAFLQAGQYTEAETVYLRGVDAGIADLHNNLGAVYIWMHDIPHAKQQYEKALSLIPYRALYHLNCGCAYLLLNEIDQAIAHLEQAVMLYPANPTMRFHLGLTLLRAGQYSDALHHLNIVQQLYPDQSLNARASSLIQRFQSRHHILPL